MQASSSSSAASRSTTANGVQRATVKKLSPSEALSALPLRVNQASDVIEGRATHVVTQHYADRILVIVTQVGKIGALTQVNTQKRPVLPVMLDDDLLENDDMDAIAHERQQRQAQREADPIDSMITTSQTLFGSVPMGQETLYDFYKQQISSVIQADLSAMEGAAGLATKPVIVGLSLALPRPNDTASSRHEENEEADFADLANRERVRYDAIFDLIRRARTW